MTIISNFIFDSEKHLIAALEKNNYEHVGEKSNDFKKGFKASLKMLDILEDEYFKKINKKRK